MTDDYFEYAIHVGASIHQSSGASRAIDYHAIQATYKEYNDQITTSLDWVNYSFFLSLTICKFFKFPISGGMYSNSLSPKYKARRVSIKNKMIGILMYCAHSLLKPTSFQSYTPIIKKLTGKFLSLKLLYDKSSTSSNGNAPNPLGNEFKRLMDKFKMRSFGSDEIETGSSGM